MNWFTNPFRADVKDDPHYAAVAEELRHQVLIPALWARAVAEAQGDNGKTKALYIKWRVLQLREAERARNKAQRRVVREQEQIIYRQTPTGSTSQNKTQYPSLVRWLRFLVPYCPKCKEFLFVSHMHICSVPSQCPRCGAVISDSANTCAGCGKQLGI